MSWTVFKKNNGLTLIELLVALVLSSVLVAALYRTFIGQQRSYTVQDQAADMQQNVRMAIDMIARYVRMAGYDPNATSNSGFQINETNGRKTDSNNIAFTVDYNGNGVIDNNDGEQIGFRLNVLELQKNLAGEVEIKITSHLV